MTWESGTFVPPPTPAPGAMSVDQQLAANAPPDTRAAIREADERAALMAASARSLARIGRAPIDPPTDWPPFDSQAPDNNTMPAASSVTAFCLPGGRAVALHEAAFMENTIPASFYPVGITVVYPGMNRRLTQIEADYLNGATP